MTDEPTREDLLAVCTFARRFAEPDFIAGEWVCPPPDPGGVAQIGYWSACEDVARWQTALHQHHMVLAFDWTDPEWVRQMRRYYADPGLLATADLLTLRKVLTTLVRSERFREGSLAVAFEREVPQAAIRRLAQMAASE